MVEERLHILDPSGASTLPRAPYNIFNIDNRREVPESIQDFLENIHLDAIFMGLQRQFGFQQDNVLCQKEHIVMLLANIKPDENEKRTYAQSTIPDHVPKGVLALHNRIFENYRFFSPCFLLSSLPLVYFLLVFLFLSLLVFPFSSCFSLLLLFNKY